MQDVINPKANGFLSSSSRVPEKEGIIAEFKSRDSVKIYMPAQKDYLTYSLRSQNRSLVIGDRVTISNNELTAVLPRKSIKAILECSNLAQTGTEHEMPYKQKIKKPYFYQKKNLTFKISKNVVD